MEIVCEKDCRACAKEGCPQRRCPPIWTLRTPDMPIIKEEVPQKNFDWQEPQKATLVD